MNQNKEVLSFIDDQLAQWPEVRERFGRLTDIRSKTLSMYGMDIAVQYNPDRARSAFAPVDSASVGKRPCFLCPENRPEEQISLPWKNYQILINPYPILPKHLTIASNIHEPQRIEDRISDMLALAKHLEGFLVLYNGPQSGASAPDHLHFQAAEAEHLPVEKLMTAITMHDSLFLDKDGGVFDGIWFWSFYIFAWSFDPEILCRMFPDICKGYKPLQQGAGEPKMNIYCRYVNNIWQLHIIPRRKHRPDCYFAEGDAQMIVSPGAIDMGGLIITPREEDFNRFTISDAEQIYRETGFADD